jgi:hypothetical protein
MLVVYIYGESQMYFQSQKRRKRNVKNQFFWGVNICKGKKDYDIVHDNPICFNFSPPPFFLKSCLTKRFEWLRIKTNIVWVPTFELYFRIVIGTNTWLFFLNNRTKIQYPVVFMDEIEIKIEIFENKWLDSRFDKRTISFSTC